MIKAYRLIRDVILFTDKRMIMADRMGISGAKVNYTTIPYKSIVAISMENAGTFDMDEELRIWVHDYGLITKKFKKGSTLDDIYRLINTFIL